jgi:hypothetical protein
MHNVRIHTDSVAAGGEKSIGEVRCVATWRVGAGLGQSGAGSAGGWGIDPTLHSLQTSGTVELKQLCQGKQAST